jgi:MoaA/NifB/PqqE/SkfB family radical SAM enzyme
MKEKIDYILFGISYWIKTKIFRMEIPFIGGLVINDRCNLRCRQCRVSENQGQNLSYTDVRNGLNKFCQAGIRSVFIEGGEPFLWRDNKYELEDVVVLARKIGFKTISLYTNGTFPIESSADVIFVSLDGLKETNNYLRGNIFDKVLQNIKNSSHKNININFTINKINCEQLKPFCEYIETIKNIKGVFFYFHTPYYGIDELFLNLEGRRKIIKQILQLKRNGAKILNSSACLKMVYRDNWKRPSKLCYVYDKNKLFECCRAIGSDQTCRECGYLGYPEIISILKLRPSSIIAAMNYLPSNTPKAIR